MIDAAMMHLNDFCACSPLDSYGWLTSDQHGRAAHLKGACEVLGCPCDQFSSLESLAERQYAARYA